MMQIFSFFAGAGFLDLGFEKAGFTTVFVNENHRPFLDAYLYARSRLQEPIEPPSFGTYDQDIVNLLTGKPKQWLQSMVREARQHDIIGFIGGPPCPDFSIGGKNRGRDGDHGKLSSSYAELICQQKPDFFLFENVKGLWKTKRHREFYEELKQVFRKSNYILTECLTNAIEYGAPQDRERIILLGFQHSLVEQKIINNSIDFPWDKFVIHPKQQVFDFPWPTINPFDEASLLPTPQSIPIELTVEHWFQQNQVTDHPNTVHGFKPRAGITRFQSVPEGDDSKKSFKRLHRWRYSPTAAYGNNEVHLHPYHARRISAAEALAIQSLPKDFTLPPSMTLSNMFKTIGNGVPFVAAHAIARSIQAFLEV